MTTMTPEMKALKDKLKVTWQSGDYGIFAKYLEDGALEFFDRLNIPPGTRLLDIACGAGQLTIPAARRGIKVTGLDLAANLVQQARARAAAEELSEVEVHEGDAEELPYGDATFDVVMSLIGAMFAPRPERVASEMIRVCKPEGMIVMGNWTPEGHVGQMFKIIGKHVPPPSYFPSPLLWGDEATCRDRLKELSALQIRRYQYPFRYPFPSAKVVDFFIEYYGPTNKAYAALDEAGKAALHNELTSLWNRNNTATAGSTTVFAEYIEVIGQRTQPGSQQQH